MGDAEQNPHLIATEKRPWTRHIVPVLVLVCIFAFVYSDYFLLEKYFSGGDFIRQQAPLMNYESDCINSGSFPMWNPFIMLGVSWVDSYMNTALLPTHFIPSLFMRLNLDFYQIELLLWMIAGGLGVYLCAIEMGASRMAALTVSACFTFSGQMSALPVWGTNVINAACLPYMFLGFRRAFKRGSSFSALTAFFAALSIFGGYISSAVISFYLLGFYVLVTGAYEKKFRLSAMFFLVTFGAGLLIALPKLLPFYLQFKTSVRFMSAPDRDPIYGYIYYSDLPNILIPVKHFFSLFAGSATVLAFFYSISRRTIRATPELLTAVLGGALLIMSPEGEYTFVRNSLNHVMPLISKIRLDFQFFIHPLLFFLLFTAPHIDSLLSQGSTRHVAIAGAAAIMASLVLFVSLYDTSLHMQSFVVHAAITAAWGALALTHGHRRVQFFIISALLLIEFSAVSSRLNIDTPAVRDADGMTLKLYSQNMASHSLRDDNLYHEGESATVKLKYDHERPSIDESRLAPEIVYSNFTDMQSSNVLNSRKFSSFWYYTQVSGNFDSIVKNYTGVLDGLIGKPFYSFLSSNSGGDGGGVELSSMTCSGFDFSVHAPSDGALLIYQMYDKRWGVSIDGGPESEVYRPKLPFMYVPLKGGEHKVSLRFRDPVFELSSAICLATIIACVALPFYMRRRRAP